MLTRFYIIFNGDYMKRIKFRFSYYLISGLLGFLLQIVSFISWSNFDVTNSLLMGKSSNADYIKFITPSIISIFGMALIALMLYGYFRHSKKEQFYVHIGGLLGGISCIVNIVSQIVFLIVTSVNRTTMYSSTSKILTLLDVLVSIKNISILILLFCVVLVMIGLFLLNNKSKIGKVGTCVGLSTSVLSFVLLFSIIVLSLANNGYNLISKFVETTQTLSEEYSFANGSMNGLTLGQAKRILMLIQEISSSYKAESFAALKASGIFAFITVVGYGISLVGNFLSMTFLIVDSFDIDKDDAPMSI